MGNPVQLRSGPATVIPRMRASQSASPGRVFNRPAIDGLLN